MTIKLEMFYFKILNAKGCGYVTWFFLRRIPFQMETADIVSFILLMITGVYRDQKT